MIDLRNVQMDSSRNPYGDYPYENYLFWLQNTGLNDLFENEHQVFLKENINKCGNPESFSLTLGNWKNRLNIAGQGLTSLQNKANSPHNLKMSNSAFSCTKFLGFKTTFVKDVIKVFAEMLTVLLGGDVGVAKCVAAVSAVVASVIAADPPSAPVMIVIEGVSVALCKALHDFVTAGTSTKYLPDYIQCWLCKSLSSSYPGEYTPPDEVQEDSKYPCPAPPCVKGDTWSVSGYDDQRKSSQKTEFARCVDCTRTSNLSCPGGRPRECISVRDACCKDGTGTPQCPETHEKFSYGKSKTYKSKTYKSM
jgi:hypothetical protein